ncbi:MAG TPA: GNAT family N-acetyltransferase [Ohtaekwangia sp.]
MHYRTANQDDLTRITRLYKTVAENKGGIARLEEEISSEYIKNFISKSISSGLIIVGEHPDNPDELIGEMHAYTPGINVFNHVFSDLTLVVHPEFQGRKIGRTLLTIFLEEIARNRPDIGRVELIARESNEKAIRLYQSLGFRIEGRLEMRIKNSDNSYEADIPMGWQNPNFEFD